MGRSESSESSRPRKKSSKEKREKGGKDKGRKEKVEKSKRRRHDRSEDVAPDLQPSGLLDEQDLRPSGLLAAEEDAVPDRLAARSRSREDPLPPRGLLGPPRPDSGGAAACGKGAFDDRWKGGGGKGFGKGGKDGGKGGGKGGPNPDGEDEVPKEEPNFEASGLLGLEDNSKNGIALKFTVPQEARLPSYKWRIYIFTKQEEKPKIVHIHRMTGVLFGKDRRVADIPTDHPTCSKQQAVLHHRFVAGSVKPYILDLGSTNGTFLNGKRIESARYYEMRERDVLKFGMSSREFVLLHAGSANHIGIDAKQLMSDSE